MDQEIPEIKPAEKNLSESSHDIPHISQLPAKKRISMPKLRFQKPNKKVAVVFGFLALVFLSLSLAIGIPLYNALGHAKSTYASAMQIKSAVSQQDLKKASTSIKETEKQLRSLQQDLNTLSWMKVVPLLGGYISDMQHGTAAGQYGLEAGVILTEALEPYADLLGFKGQGSPVAGNAEERIAKTIETLDKITPQMDKMAQKMNLIKKEVDQIDPNRYPESFSGKSIRPKIVELKEIVNLADSLLTQAKPMVKKSPELLGSKGDVKYLVLFQNDKELRPTGGFITAYAVFRVNKGKIALESSDDIYKLDDTVTTHVTPPEAISKNLNVNGWRLRDSNFSPDFASSARTFLDIYSKSTKHVDVAGVIVVDTQALVRMMDVLGPINIYGTNFTTKTVPQCNCPMVVYSLLEQAGQPRGYWVDNRKDMIGILLQALMKKALDAPSNMNAQLFQTGLKLASEKHILVYLKDSDAQKGIETLGFAGRIKDSQGDYLHVNDANLGGGKANLFIVRSVKQDVAITDSGATESLTVDYKYPREADNCSLERKEGLCLAGRYRNYLRIYLPKGSKVTEMRGFMLKGEVFEDLDHTVVAGFHEVFPQGLGKIQIKYEVAGNFKKQGEYRSLIQKQPGTDAEKYTVTVNGTSQEFELKEDKEITVKL